MERIEQKIFWDISVVIELEDEDIVLQQGAKSNLRKVFVELSSLPALILALSKHCEPGEIEKIITELNNL